MEQEVLVERMSEAVVALEAAVARLEERVAGIAAAEEGPARIVATALSAREEDLERKLAEAEEKVARLEAAGASGRKTAGVGRMTAKERGEGSLSAALDGALGSLSVEQRIAVKAELLRAGVV